MDIELQMIPVREVVKGYTDNDEEGVYGLDGKLNIRPKYQRNFIYNDKQRVAVINTVVSGFPLNTMYWMENEDDTYEVLDGQQRTISICQYANNEFSRNFQYFFNLTKDEQEKFLDYPLMVYICKGTDKERLEWFKTINIAGEKLTNQELRNAVYTGKWLTDAKRHFSKTGCPAADLGSKYLSGKSIRQEYLETVLRWKAAAEEKVIEQYMAEHQHDPQAGALWSYFVSVLEWVKSIFPEYMSEMKGIEWGLLYNKHKDEVLDPEKLKKKINLLIDDPEVQNIKGIFEYLLEGNESCLNLRTFDDKMKRKKYNEQKGICPLCKQHFEIKEMEGDHIVPWHDGGKTEYPNLQMLCKHCNRTKSGK